MRITEIPIVMPSISPDGNSIIGTLPLRGMNNVVTLPLNGGQPKLHLAVQGAGPKVHWSADGKSVLYAVTRDGMRNIFRRSIVGDEQRQLTQFSDNQIGWFHPSPDGKRLAVVRGHAVLTVMKVESLP
jgi:Tol biopolymer transport system component